MGVSAAYIAGISGPTRGDLLYLAAHPEFNQAIHDLHNNSEFTKLMQHIAADPVAVNNLERTQVWKLSVPFMPPAVKASRTRTMNDGSIQVMIDSRAFEDRAELLGTLVHEVLGHAATGVLAQSSLVGFSEEVNAFIAQVRVQDAAKQQFGGIGAPVVLGGSPGHPDLNLSELVVECTVDGVVDWNKVAKWLSSWLKNEDRYTYGEWRWSPDDPRRKNPNPPPVRLWMTPPPPVPDLPPPDQSTVSVPLSAS